MDKKSIPFTLQKLMCIVKARHPTFLGSALCLCNQSHRRSTFPHLSGCLFLQICTWGRDSVGHHTKPDSVYHCSATTTKNHINMLYSRYNPKQFRVNKISNFIWLLKLLQHFSDKNKSNNFEKFYRIVVNDLVGEVSTQSFLIP